MKKIMLLLLLSSTLNVQVPEDQILKRFDLYIKALNTHQFRSPEYRSFKRDTVHLWHGKRQGDPILSVYNPFSDWKQWDVIMNGHKTIDSITFIPNENKITARFQETTDFLTQIGMLEGFKATMHYWLDQQGLVKEVLYDWSSNNPDFTAQIKPVVDWAIKNESTEIADLYLENGFEPSWINGIRWKRIMDKYGQDSR